jgi:hypothetical protein
MIPGPLGVAASGALGGVGEGIRQGVLAATGAEGAPRSIPEAMKNIGVETAVQAGTSAIGSGVSKVLGKVFKRWIDPAELYQSALGPVPSTGKKAIDEMVATGLKERIPVSAEGLHRAESLINDIHKEVEAMIATKAGAPINPRDVVKRLDAVRARWSQTPENLKAIDDIELKFLEQYKTQGSLTAASAQEKKKQLYKQIRQGSSNAYAENRVAPPEIDLESQKELARGLKEEIIDMHPVLKGKGIREGDLIPLERALDRWASRQSNHKMLNVFGLIGTAMGGVVGGGAGGPEGAAIGAVAPAAAWLVKSVMDSPEVKSGLAIAMKRAGRYVPENTTKVINLPNAIRAAREGVFGHPVEKKEH